MSTAACYLARPPRHNLRVATGAVTEALLLEGPRCDGRPYSIGGEMRGARADAKWWSRRGDPVAPDLELSGIGEPARLRGHGIAVGQALPAVGENLSDHYAPRTRWAVGAKGYTFNDRGRGLGLVGQAMRFALTRGGGMLSMVGRTDARLPALTRGAGRRPTCCWAGCRC